MNFTSDLQLVFATCNFYKNGRKLTSIATFYTLTAVSLELIIF